MNKKRPINLDLFTIKFPITAIISILHRISGVLLFLLIPVFLWMLKVSLSDPMGFSDLQAYLNKPLIKLMIFGFLAALLYHMFAGIRHLLMDTGWGEDLETARLSARGLILLTVVVVLLAGVWLW